MPTTFYVIPTKLDGRAYSLILGRPWLYKVKIIKKWKIGDLILQGRTRRCSMNLEVDVMWNYYAYFLGYSY